MSAISFFSFSEIESESESEDESSECSIFESSIEPELEDLDSETSFLGFFGTGEASGLNSAALGMIAGLYYSSGSPFMFISYN